MTVRDLPQPTLVSGNTRIHDRCGSSMTDDILLNAFRASPHATVVTRLRDGLIVDSNDSFEQWSGYKRHESVGTSATHLWADEEQRQHMVRLATKHGRLSDFDCHAIVRSGEVRHCQISARVIDLRGEQHLISAVQDITELRQLQRELLRSADRERQQLASELHDGLAQDLAGVSYLLGSLEKQLKDVASIPCRQLKQLREVVEKAIENARAIARGFSPIEMSQGGLAVALYRLRLDIATIHNVEVHIEFHTSVQLNEASSASVYAIIHEAVINAAKHGNCRSIQVALDIVNKNLVVTVQDDGQGIEEQSSNHGMGIRLMKHRAAVLGGRLHIGSTAGKGTLVRCNFDFDAVLERDKSPRLHLI